MYLLCCSNYHQIQSLAYEQHEMATETISMQQGLQDKGYEEWVIEMIGMREILRYVTMFLINYCTRREKKNYSNYLADNLRM